MRQGIHPEYTTATVHCACGNTFETRSTLRDIHVEICSVCHPFFTGKQKLVDTAGRVERFKRKYGQQGKRSGEVSPESAEQTEQATAEAGAKKESA